MFANLTKGKITTLVALLVGIGVAYGYFNPEQAALLNGLGASIAAVVLAFTQDPK